ncbi:hypothetical protein I317_01606 [Kwoniella heveanensis CBS 569]|nr:hypothetical protein I317_01606 [Kwoniella heveanensis CBS 569]
MFYEITEYDIRYWNAMAGIAAGIALILALFVLGSALWIHQYKGARHVLDRISFRIVLWSMAWEIVYSVNYLIVCGRGLEKWYVIGSTVLGLGVPIAPAALGHLGYDPDFGTCHGSSDSLPDYRPATASVFLTMVCLIKHGRATKKLLLGGNTLNREIHRVTLSDESDGTGQTSSGSWCLPPVLMRRDCTQDSQRGKAKLVRLGRRRRARLGARTLQDRLLEIALKISLYPVALIIVNGILTAGDLYLTITGGVNSRSDFILFLVYNFLYGGRGIIFACLGIFVDPCLARGFKAVLRLRREERRKQNSDLEQDATPHANVMSVGRQEKQPRLSGKLVSNRVKGTTVSVDPACNEFESTALDQLASLRYGQNESIDLNSGREGTSQNSSSMMPQLVVTFPDGRRSFTNGNENDAAAENASGGVEGDKHEATEDGIGSGTLGSAQSPPKTKAGVASSSLATEQAGLVVRGSPGPRRSPLGVNENARSRRSSEVYQDSARQSQDQPPPTMLIRRGSDRLVTGTLECEEVERLFQEAQAKL